MWRNLLGPALAFVSGAIVLRLAVPAESVLLMVAGLGLCAVGLLRLAKHPLQALALEPSTHQPVVPAITRGSAPGQK